MADVDTVVATLARRHVRLRLTGASAAADEGEGEPGSLAFKEGLNLDSVAIPQRELSGVQIIRAA